MAEKKYLDLVGLGKFKNKLVQAFANNSSTSYPVHYADISNTATTAYTADAWSSARTVTFDGTSGDVSGSFSIDGSANVTGVILNVDGLSDKVDKHGTDRLMTADEATKLSNIETGAQVNVIENVSVDGTNQTITNKTVTLNLSAYAKKSDIVSAMSFKGSKTGTQLAALTTTDVINGDIYTCSQDGAKDEGTANEFNFYAGYEYAAVLTPEVPAQGEEGDPDYVPAVPASLSWVELGKYLDLSSYVSGTRTVNNKALSSDITLDTSDIPVSNGYSKPVSSGSITSSDSIDTAIGKLEKKADDNATAISNLQGAATTYTFAEGSTNGAFQVTPTTGGTAGSTQTVSIHGLGTAAYSATTDFVPSNLTPAEAGAQVNVIEGITVNGSAVTPDSNKIVSITIPSAAVSDVQVSTNGTTYSTVVSNSVAQINLSPYAVDSDFVEITETEINGLFPSATPEPEP